jgi:Asp-tRNA(Asn)/Glu-tRNA(Gln) amidotransferase C subunit
MERIVITFQKDGTFRGASITDFEGLPVPVDQSRLEELVPGINQTAIARVTELAGELAKVMTNGGQPTDMPAKGVTKLTIKRRLDALGKWETFKAILAQAPEAVQDEWTLAQEIRADDPMFTANRDAFRDALGMTEEEFEGILTAGI